jgi:AraC-like DNA-binding protein
VKFDSLNILCVSRCKYEEQTYVEKHCHNFYHLIYVTGGSGLLGIRAQSFKAEEHDLYLAAPGVVHEIQSDAGDPLRTLELKFIAAGDWERLLSPLPVRSRNRHARLQTILETLVLDASTKQPFYQQFLKIKAGELLLLLIRVHANRQGPQDGGAAPAESLMTAADGNALAERVRTFIHDHYNRRWDLRSLADRFEVSHTYLCKIFKQRFGVSPNQYAMQLQLKKAKELLLASDYTITEIAERTGFGSIHYMSRLFTQRERISPIEFRQRAKDTIHVRVEERYRIVNRNVHAL